MSYALWQMLLGIFFLIAIPTSPQDIIHPTEKINIMNRQAKDLKVINREFIRQLPGFIRDEVLYLPNEQEEAMHLMTLAT
ncbi:MAG: hypothetical protein R2824_27220 [Saprospiraceae bacterium]|nr:hypothetical protein [Lewinella sp.]